MLYAVCCMFQTTVFTGEEAPYSNFLYFFPFKLFTFKNNLQESSKYIKYEVAELFL
jgi:hypothetical protein